MDKEQKCLAICLKTQDYKENDKILYLLTANGKVNAIIKGVKKKNAKLKAVCQPFCIAEYIIVYKGDMAVVSNATVNATNFNILSDYNIYESAINALKIAYSLSYQIQNDSMLFSLLISYIRQLNDIASNKSNTKYKHLTNIFLIDILSIAGYGLNTQNCTKCQGILNKGAFFNELNGYFYCEHCYLDTKNLISKKCLDYIASPNNFELQDEIIDEVFILLKKCLKIYFNYEF